jgi:hypothetical protein
MIEEVGMKYRVDFVEVRRGFVWVEANDHQLAEDQVRRMSSSELAEGGIEETKLMITNTEEDED